MSIRSTVRSFRRKNGRVRNRIRHIIRRTTIVSGTTIAIVLLLGPVTWHQWVLGAGNPFVGESPESKPVAIIKVAKAATEVKPTSVRVFDCLASWFSEGDPGINPRMANGERFDDGELVVAMRGVAPYGTRVKISAKETGAVVFARIADWGPSRRFPERCIDLSRATWEATGVAKSKGLQRVHVELLR